MTLLIGWPGYISVFAAPITALSNLVQFGQSRFLAKPDLNAQPPVIEADDAEKLHAALPLIMDHFEKKRRRDIHRTTADLAMQVGVRPAQLIVFLRNLARAGEASQTSARGRGFEVLPPPPAAGETESAKAAG